ncbi:MAG: tRNA pseudouridine(13) synthase TruD [Bacillota bacterium]
MKLKVHPDEFVVRERADLPSQERGEYRVYLLEKRGWTTEDALQRIAREQGIPYRLFSYGGKKDRHAHTYQHVTVRRGAAAPYQESGLNLVPAGWMDRPMGPDLIRANDFQMVLRSLSVEEARLLEVRWRQLANTGFANYFDDQRFGSQDPGRGWLAERLLKRQWKGALQVYLLNPAGRRRELAAYLEKHWGDWKTCLLGAQRAGERAVLEALAGDPGGYLRALQAIPARELSLHFSAYQAFLWNEVLRRYLSRQAKELWVYPGAAGPYLFNAHPLPGLPDLVLPLPASRASFADALAGGLYRDLLSERGLTPGSFNLRRLRQAYFKPLPRPALVWPAGLALEGPGPDELYCGRLRAGLTFSLPAGSYGTMLVKALLAQPTP